METIHTSDFQPSRQPYAFPLQGSKRGQVPIIRNLVPSGNPKLFEPFCGSAAVAIGLRFYGVVGSVEISDANQDIINLWQEILDNPESLANRYKEVWDLQFQNPDQDPNSYFRLVRERFNGSKLKDSADFLFLLNRIVKAALRYGKSGNLNQGADSRRNGARPEVVKERLLASSQVMEGARARCIDWADALETATEQDVVYLDPPYQGTSDTKDQRYISGLDVERFESVLEKAQNRNLSLIVSYDALTGPALYGRPLSESLDLMPLDIVTGVSAQGTLLGRRQESHETLYLSRALVERLGGKEGVLERVYEGSIKEGQLTLNM